MPKLSLVFTLALISLISLSSLSHAQEASQPAPETVPTESIQTGPGADQDSAPTDGAPEPTVADEVEVEVRRGSSMIDLLAQGGITVVFLLILSVAGLSFFLDRVFRLRRNAIVPADIAEQARTLWKAGQFEKLRQICSERSDTLSRVIESFVRHRHCQALELSQMAGDIAGRELRGHLQKAYPMAVVATLAPLLGLFGTVIGMIESFEVVAIAGSLGDASLLAGGISKALVTTAVGLGVAVPFLAAYHYFRSRTNTFAMELEGEVNELLATWFLDQEEASAKAAAPAAELTSENSSPTKSAL